MSETQRSVIFVVVYFVLLAGIFVRDWLSERSQAGASSQARDHSTGEQRRVARSSGSHGASSMIALG
ncbi:hypothetical protein [Olsenella sp. HMSC062G07]|uniref:hypothetical protein n=1 Tax=Olsenella sp. HMSC062G07 TaxID=1739330 RepID=UPI0008A50626|nr:hypothetical protein [Olsenella sp. HMSC062G07]OFK23172.1 hypothetical protein HMPREF2826_00410 [Olsenella sp. HMSC062G07]